MVGVVTVGSEGVASVVMGVVGTAELVEGPADSVDNLLDVQNVLDVILCDQDVVNGSDAHQPASAAATSAAAYCNH